MNFVQITPGAGGMYCGNCLRDNALVAELRRAGHQALMLPLYLPLTLDEPDQSAGNPIFFGGVSVYLEQKSALFRVAPRWFHRLLARRGLLHWAAGRAARTQPQQVGDVTLSMLRGEEGRQAREIEELAAWLKSQPRPDVIVLSNALLVGMLRRLREILRCPVICMLAGEDSFLDALPEPHRALCWETIATRVREADLLLAPSHYFADLMTRRLQLPPDKIQVRWNGIALDGYTAQETSTTDTSPAPALGFFARMCREKGLDTLVEAYLAIRRAGRVPGLKLKIGGSCGPSDQPFVDSLSRRLADEGALGEVEFHPNLERASKLEFLQNLSVFSVPARYGEAFGLYLLEAWAAGVPVVQPRTASFPELVAATGGGVLCEPEQPEALARQIEKLLLEPKRARELGRNGRQAVFEKFSAAALARNMVRAAEGIRLQEGVKR